jgi:hypothetical protein
MPALLRVRVRGQGLIRRHRLKIRDRRRKVHVLLPITVHLLPVAVREVMRMEAVRGRRVLPAVTILQEIAVVRHRHRLRRRAVTLRGVVAGRRQVAAVVAVRRVVVVAVRRAEVEDNR